MAVEMEASSVALGWFAEREERRGAGWDSLGGMMGIVPYESDCRDDERERRFLLGRGDVTKGVYKEAYQPLFK